MVQKPDTITMSTAMFEDVIRLIGNLPTSSQAFTLWSPLTQIYTKAIESYNQDFEGESDQTEEENG